MGARATTGRFGAAFLALTVVAAAAFSASDAPTLKGRFLGGVDAGVWLGVVGDDGEGANWSHVEGNHFEVPLPPGQQARLVAIAKDRVPLVVPVPLGAQDRRAELRLVAGIALDGTVNSEDGRPLRDVNIRAVPSDAVTLEGLGRAGYAVSLRETRIELPLTGSDSIEVPPSARPTWKTNREGAFRVGGLETGRHYVEATAEGYVPVLLKDVAIRDEAANRLDLVLFKAFFVTGHVVDHQGVPVARAEVRADWVQPSEARHRVGAM